MVVELIGLAFVLLVVLSLYIALHTLAGYPKDSLWGYSWIITIRNVIVVIFVVTGLYLALETGKPGFLKTSFVTILLLVLLFKRRSRV